MKTSFTLGESSEDVLENVCFIVLRMKKRRANTKIGATFTSFWFMYQTLYKCYSRSPLFGHLLNSDTFFRALHFEPGRSPYDLFVLFFLVNSLSTDIRHYSNTFLWSRRQLSSPIHYFCSIIRMRVRVNVFGVNIYFTEVFVLTRKWKDLCPALPSSVYKYFKYIYANRMVNFIRNRIQYIDNLCFL